jgi:uridine phosphorylase
MLQPHIQLEESLHIRHAILPGDPARLDRIALQLEQVEELAYNREFRSLRGLYKGLPVLAISTGIGGSSAGIAIEELRNIGVTAMVRIGSCGALQSDIALGDLIFACGAIRDDGASRAYVDVRYPAVPDTALLGHCIAAARENGWPCHTGVVHSHESFYIDTNDAESAHWAACGALGADMETAALFTIGRLRGVRTASILNNVVLWGQDTADSIGDYADGEDLTAVGERREIAVALEALYRLDREECKR